jgi:hypothetical protein
MARPPEDLLNLLGEYFSQTSITYRLIGQMRESIFTRNPLHIPPQRLYESRGEIERVTQQIDESTPQSAQDFNSLVFKNDKVAAFLVVKGDLVTENDEVVIANTVVPVYLGTNPWLLYQGRGGYDTVDTKISLEQTQYQIIEREEEFRREGIAALLVKESSFHYARDKDLKAKFPDGLGGFNTFDFIRYLIDTQGYIGMEPAIKPTKEEYEDSAMVFTSYRQKQSVLEKTIRELCQSEAYRTEGDIITDWGALRVGFPTEQEAISFAIQFQVADIRQRQVEIGRFDANVLHIDDYYSNPKSSGFKSFNIAVLFKSRPKLFEDVVREIQIYDWMMHYKAQIDETDPAFHRTIRASQVKSGARRRKRMENLGYDAALALMFGADKQLRVELPHSR